MRDVHAMQNKRFAEAILHRVSVLLGRLITRVKCCTQTVEPPNRHLRSMKTGGTQVMRRQNPP